MVCRICHNKTNTVLDLGFSPPANSLLPRPDIELEKFPLVLEYCQVCGNLQLKDCLKSDDLYKNYFYVTPDSKMLQGHYEFLTSFLFNNGYLNRNSNLVEVGSNIGHYLKYLSPHVKSIVGIDPAQNIAEKANSLGIPTICDFFDEKSAAKILSERGSADAIIARHCFAHNESPHPLLKSAKKLLSEDGCLIVENAYAVNTIENNEFDQIYHEHMFYYSVRSMTKALEMNGLILVDILISLVHGGSITFVAKHRETANRISTSVNAHLMYEQAMLNEDSLKTFSDNAFKLRDDLNKFLAECVKSGKTIQAYGATAKGNTLLNFLGVNNKQIKYCVDSTDIKKGMYLPGSHIEIIGEEAVLNMQPDFYLLTAWNYKDEIINKVREMRNYKSTFIVPFPSMTIV